MHQLFCDLIPSEGSLLRLGGEERHYLGRALRARPGETVRLAALDGSAALGVLEAFEGEEALLRVGASLDDAPEPFSVTLGLCAPRGDALGEALDAAVQCGVSGVELLRSERTLANFQAHSLSPERLEKRLKEAARQCLRARPPGLAGPTAFRDFLIRSAEGARRLFFSERGGEPQARACAGAPLGTPFLILVGPEGGFTAAEQEAARAAGWTPVTLGPRPMRVPVACAAALGGLRALAPEA